MPGGITPIWCFMPYAWTLCWKGSVGWEWDSCLFKWPWLWCSTGDGALASLWSLFLPWKQSREEAAPYRQQGEGLGGGSSSVLLRKASRTGTPNWESPERSRESSCSFCPHVQILLLIGCAAECWWLCKLLHGVSFTLSKIARWREAAPEKDLHSPLNQSLLSNALLWESAYTGSR